MKMKNEILKNLLLDDSLPSSSQKNLSKGLMKKGGRNNLGRITIRRRGGGHKRRLLNIDFNGTIGQFSHWHILRFIYNPNSSSNKKLALCVSTGGRIKYLPYLDHMQLLDPAPIPQSLGEFRVGTICSNIDGRFIRSAGNYGTIVKKEGNLVVVKLPSGEWKSFLKKTKGFKGRIGNEEHRNFIIGKAGRNRWLGLRPRVRGEAMNPVDHPHGGKSSRSGGLGKPFKNLWGQLAKWS